MNNIDFRLQSIVAPPTSTGVVKIYANASGQLLYVNSNGTTGSAGSAFAQNLSQAAGSIASGVIQPGVSATATPSGAYYGVTGTSALANKLPLFLGAPNEWLVAVGSSGQRLVIPAYTYTV